MKCIKICVTEDQIVKSKSISKHQNPEKQTKILNLYPNPASESFYIDISTKQEGAGKITIHDLTGSKILEKSINLKEGNQTIEQSISKISKGMYLYTVEINGEIISKRFVID